MSLKNFFKSNTSVRIAVKKIKIYISFLNDANDFCKYFLEVAEQKGLKHYRIMLLVHSLEKGMCMPDVRPFGQSKAIELVNILNSMTDSPSFEYQLGVSVLESWIAFFEAHNFVDDTAYISVKNFIIGKVSSLPSGNKEFVNPRKTGSSDFPGVILSRHSVRDFEDKVICEDDLMFALSCFIEAPTACNRQMCRIYQIKNPDSKALLNKTVLGVSGFSKERVTYFVVTYDMAAFDFYGERNQGYLNAGLAAMNFVNGLHYKGIGSCFLQWANKRSDDLMVRKMIGIPPSERIAVVIGAGYYKDVSTIPYSCRRKIESVFRII